MNKKELMKKVNANEGLTVEEIIEYQKIVKPVKHVYGTTVLRMWPSRPTAWSF